MCGRISTGYLTPETLTSHFGLAGMAPFSVSFNLAPSLPIPVIRNKDGRRWLDSLVWGLIPFWAREREALHPFNARIETLRQKPTFRKPFQHQRCIVPVSGFYEWQQQGEHKQPYYVCRGDGQPLALAGLWDRWADPDGGDVLESCCVITVPSGGTLWQIHERMPGVLETDWYAAWLDPAFVETHVLQDLLRRPRVELLKFYPVSAYVNRSGHEGEQCCEEVG